jgi:hypothetical protein
MLNSKQLKLQFKGNRNYLHGSDIYNETLTWLKLNREDVESIDFSFHHIATHQLCAIVGVLPDGIDPVAICLFTTDGAREQLYIVESDDIVTERYHYPEEEIISQMEIDLTARRCVLRGGIAYSDIELWVAMAKALHYKVFPLISGKWFFVRGRFPKYELRSQSLERTLHIVSTFNNKLTKSEVFLNNQMAGEIYFSVV